jgi:hypothetical protein
VHRQEEIMDGWMGEREREEEGGGRGRRTARRAAETWLLRGGGGRRWAPPFRLLPASANRVALPWR